MNRKELWQIFMKTGKVSDYLNYKNAAEYADDVPFYDTEFADELTADDIDDLDDIYSSIGKELDDFDKDGWYSDT